MGQTRLLGGKHLLTIMERNGRAVDNGDGCAAENERAIGTYMHGLFDTPALIDRWLTAVGLTGIMVPETGGLAAKMQQYCLLADHFRDHVDMQRIGALVGMNVK